ncbi:DUF3052 family protein [Bradyrhizobium tropiciagri]|uniref:DUF3052 family protein n=1 Tax=Bradyrhizobium tropiciagri TaxID=312253 RepID=UPI0012FEB037|nr:DUF3052 family protein [Bradyrhizobium tropiciagri]
MRSVELELWEVKPVFVTMGQEIKCKVVVGGRKAEGRLQLETERLYFRSPTEKLDVATKDVKVKASKGVLFVSIGKTQYEFELGAVAERWADRIQNPKSLVQKLGVKAGASIVAIGRRDAELIDELKKVGAKISARKGGKDHDWVFVGVEQPGDLNLLEGLTDTIKSNGAVWIIFPKGRSDLKAEHLIATGKANGLVDTKVARVSDRLTGMKFVIPVKQRK